MEINRTEGAGNETSRRALILRLAERVLYPLVVICMRNGVLAPELVKIVEWAAARAALHEPEFAVPGRTDKHAQSAAHAAVISGLQRARIKRIGAQEKPPVDAESGELNRLLRILTAWRTAPRYQDENGKPLDIRLNGSHPSLHQLRVKYGNDTTTRAIADALVKLGCAEWVGDSDVTAREKTLRLVTGLIAVKDDSKLAISILAQHSGDFLSSVEKALDASLLSSIPDELPRFRQIYFNDIDVDHAVAAQRLVHEEMQSSVERIAKIMERFRVGSGKVSVRLGVGMYSFKNNPLLQI